MTTIQDNITALETKRSEQILELRRTINPQTRKLWTYGEIAGKLGFKSKQACYYHAKRALEGSQTK